MTNTFKKMALPVAIASALFAAGFASATPTVEATSKAQYPNQALLGKQFPTVSGESLEQQSFTKSYLILVTIRKLTFVVFLVK